MRCSLTKKVVGKTDIKQFPYGENDTARKNMKLKNQGIVAEVNIPTIGGSLLSREYRERWRALGGNEESEEGGNWVGWKSFHDRMHSQLYLPDEHPAFTACIVSYDYPDSLNLPLDRRHALAALRRLGLQSPSTPHAVRFAVQTIRSKQTTIKISEANMDRQIVAPTPIHPEYPEFYYFGESQGGWFEGSEGKSCLGKGSFESRKYWVFEGKSGLYFSCGNVGLSPDGVKANRKNNFPLILGVKNAIKFSLRYN